MGVFITFGCFERIATGYVRAYKQGITKGACVNRRQGGNGVKRPAFTAASPGREKPVPTATRMNLLRKRTES